MDSVKKSMREFSRRQMAPLADLKEKRLPACKEGTSSEDCKHLSLSAASMRKEVFDGMTKI